MMHTLTSSETEVAPTATKKKKKTLSKINKLNKEQVMDGKKGLLIAMVTKSRFYHGSK